MPESESRFCCSSFGIVITSNAYKMLPPKYRVLFFLPVGAEWKVFSLASFLSVSFIAANWIELAGFVLLFHFATVLCVLFQRFFLFIFRVCTDIILCGCYFPPFFSLTKPCCWFSLPVLQLKSIRLWKWLLFHHWEEEETTIWAKKPIFSRAKRITDIIYASSLIKLKSSHSFVESERMAGILSSFIRDSHKLCNKLQSWNFQLELEIERQDQ